jgi:hypothetical protein
MLAWVRRLHSETRWLLVAPMRGELDASTLT